MEMDGIEHRTIHVNGIKMHVAEKGNGPAVLFIHGFPELWYSWRHQILGLAARGYRAVAPDMRGYGDTDAPPSPTSYTVFHLVGDLIALLDALGLEKVFVVGQDWGAIIAWYMCLFRPDRVKALVNMSVNFLPRIPFNPPVQMIREKLGEQHYISRFQEPGAAEAEFSRVTTAKLMKKILTVLPPSIGISSIKEDSLPSWLSEKDLNYFADKFEKTGFTGGLNYYRALDLDWELLAPWTDAQVKVPVKFIIGEFDITYNTPGAKEYIHNGRFNKDVPLLEEFVVLKGVGHFINQERPDEINDHIVHFIQKF